MREYPLTPSGWTVAGRRSLGPFQTHVTFRDDEGRLVEWASRRHRKHSSRISRAGPGERAVWWAPRRASWWIGVLFAIGATCFTIGPLPGFVERFGSGVDGAVFFIGSIFFTTAAGLQCLETFNADRGPGGQTTPFRVLVLEPRRIDWWACIVQFVGTLFFNVMTFRAMRTGLSSPEYDRLVWAPDVIGSACFLASGYLAYLEVGARYLSWRPRDLEWTIAAVNLLGCIAFGISAVAAYVVPTTGSMLDLAAANGFTAIGGACFLAGAVLLLPESAAAPQVAVS